MSTYLHDQPFTDRDEEGELVIEIGVVVHRNSVHVTYSTPEHCADFSFDNTVGMALAEAYSHPAFVERFIEKTIGDGEVKYHFDRRSDALADVLAKRSDPRKGSK